MKKIKIFFITSFDEDSNYKKVTNVVNNAISYLKEIGKKEFKIQLYTLDNISHVSVAVEILQLVQEADIIISNLSSYSPNSMYEMGLSHALRKPTIILLNNELQHNFDLLHNRFITYGTDALNSVLLVEKIAETIYDAINNPELWIFNEGKKENKATQKTLFVSYSHKDNLYLNRLKVHIKPLERNGSIQLWSDTLIQSG
ncbi:MAG: hypothetical protein AAF489_15940, partial [Bacteroidota bacterium]